VSVVTSDEHSGYRLTAGALIERQRLELEPLDETPGARHLCLRTDRSLEEVAEDVEASLDRLLARAARPRRRARLGICA
jgi:hypothetical protein